MAEHIGQDGKMVDYFNVWSCIKHGQFEEANPYAVYSCESYPPLLIQIGSIMKGKEIYYKQFLLLLFGLLMPLVLFKYTNNPITVFFYFSATNYFWALLTSSFFAQALALMLILSMGWLKEWQRIAVLFLSIIAHSTSFLMALGFYLLLLIQENKFKLPQIFVGCSPFWGKTGPPAVIDGKMPSAVLSNTAGYLTPNVLLSVFFKRIPIPFAYFSVKELIKKNQIALLGLFFFSFMVGAVFHERAFYFMALPMVIGLTWYYEKSETRMKNLILLISGLLMIFHILQFFMVLQC